MWAAIQLIIFGGTSSASGSAPSIRAFAETDYVPTLAL